MFIDPAFTEAGSLVQHPEDAVTASSFVRRRRQVTSPFFRGGGETRSIAANVEPFLGKRCISSMVSDCSGPGVGTPHRRRLFRFVSSRNARCAYADPALRRPDLNVGEMFRRVR